jgi:hypothetical protein
MTAESARCTCSFCIEDGPVPRAMVHGPAGLRVCDDVIGRARALHRLIDCAPPRTHRSLGVVDANAFRDVTAGARLVFETRTEGTRVWRAYLAPHGGRTLLALDSAGAGGEGAAWPDPPPKDAGICGFCGGPSGAARVHYSQDEAVMCAVCVSMAAEALGIAPGIAPGIE